MIVSRVHSRGRVVGLAGALVALLLLVWGAPAAQAGQWMQVSCVNPDGSAAPNEGWTGSGSGPLYFGAVLNTHCAPGKPMQAILGANYPAPSEEAETLRYSAPSGSQLVGGSLDTLLSVPGYGPAENARAIAGVFQSSDPSIQGDPVLLCVQGGTRCPNDLYKGQVALPPGNNGGNVSVLAQCFTFSSGQCSQPGGTYWWSLAQVFSAHFLLLSNAAPIGSQFSGSALQRNAGGTAHVVFNASDPGGANAFAAPGPGIYRVTVQVDGRTVWAGTPNNNGGRCVPVGTDPGSGALMFDWQQPCPTAEVIDAPVPTSGLPDGPHRLAVTVLDAAQNSSTVIDQTVSTFNPQVKCAGKVCFKISWRWHGARTKLRSITTLRAVPPGTSVSIRCRGRGCPRLDSRRAQAVAVRPVLRTLGGKVFRVGDRLEITVSAPGRRTKRIELIIHNNRRPTGRVRYPSRRAR